MNKDEKSLLLFEQIGGVDEKILHECSSLYPAVRKRKKRTARILILAAALTLVMTTFTVFIGAAAIRSAGRVLHGLTAKNDAAPHEEQKNDGESGMQTVGESELRPLLFSGKPTIIVRRANGVYAAQTLSSYEFRRIMENRSDPASLTPDQSAPGAPVWVCDGRGAVFTPYLKDGNGNISYGELFEYEPEVVPNEEVQSILERHIS